MPRIGFLACETTLPGAGEARRGDAFEHDLMVAALGPALAGRGFELAVIDWEAPLEAFTGIDAALLGTAWNYQDKAAAFLEKLDALEGAGIAVHNPSAIVRWNITKTYLQELGQRGAPMIPTLWEGRVSADQARAAMDEFGCEKLVVKRQIGAGAQGQELLERAQVADEWAFEAPAMLQPFLPAIAERGELSFVFVDGALSHALSKHAKPGDYRIQSIYGGTERVHTPSPAERDAAHAVLAALPFAAPLYARVDMVALADGTLGVMEVELIEPYLYPEQGPLLGDMLAAAIARRIE